jgi:GPH family glycoside/pentoside/hexuronide:cation symporter
MAIAAAVLMVAAILTSALGTHREIKRLPRPALGRQSVRGHFRELAQTMKNRAFVVLMLAGLFAYTNQGIGYAMANYMYSYVWQLGPALTLMPFVLMAGVLIAFAAAPIIGRYTSKPTAAFTVTAIGGVLQMAPYVLRLLGLFPVPGTNAFLPVYFAFNIVANALSVSGFIIGASMMADVVEESEAHTGRRSEGVFFAGSFFIQKCTSGVGIFLAGAILSLAHFPARATPGAIPEATLDRLTLIYILIYLVLCALAALCFTRFPFGRAEHEARLARMAASAEAEGAPHAP